MSSLSIAGQLRAGKLWVANHPVRAATFAGWLQQVVTGLGALISIPILIRTIGSDITGVWLAFQGFVMLAGLADAGFGIALTRQAAHCLKVRSEEKLNDFVWFGKGIDGVVSLLKHSNVIYSGCLIFALLLGFAAYDVFVSRSQLAESSGENPRLLWYLMLIGPCGLLYAGKCSALLNGCGYTFLTRILSAGFFATQTAATVVSAFLSQSLIVMAISTAVVGIIYAISIDQICRSILLRGAVGSGEPVTRARILQFARVAFPLGFVNVGVFLISTIQVPLVGFLLGPSVVAPYFIAQRVGQFLMQAALQINQPRTIEFTSLIAHGSRRDALQTARSTIKTVAVSLVFSQLIFVSVISHLGYFLLDGAPAPAMAVQIVMAVDFLILGITATMSQFVLASGVNPFAISTVIAGIISCSLMVVIVPRIGLIGVPLVSLTTGILVHYSYSTICYLVMRRRLGT